MSFFRNLTAIEESASLLSDADISYDKTEEELEVSYLRSGRSWKRSLQVAAANAEIAATIADANNDHASPDRKKKRQSVRPIPLPPFLCFLSLLY